MRGRVDPEPEADDSMPREKKISFAILIKALYNHIREIIGYAATCRHLRKGENAQIINGYLIPVFGIRQCSWTGNA